MPDPLTQYVFRVMRWPNLTVESIVDISRVIPVYISHICYRRHLELYGGVLVIAQKDGVRESVPYHLGEVISHALSKLYEGLHDIGQKTD